MTLSRSVVAALFIACVPATEEVDPRGGIVARVVPSASTSGQPFQTVDGWTVTVEKFAIRASLTAERRLTSENGYIGGFGMPRILTPSEGCELRAVAISVGPVQSTLNLMPAYRGFEKLENESVCNVDPALLPFFDGKGVSSHEKYFGDVPDDFQNSPSVVLLGHAEKDGRTIRLELALDATSYGGAEEHGVETMIVANQGAVVRIAVDASALFLAVGPESHAVPFDRVADADLDDNGIVTASELSNATTECYSSGGDEEDGYESCDTVLRSIVEWNVAYLFGPAK